MKGNRKRTQELPSLSSVGNDDYDDDDDDDDDGHHCEVVP